MMISSSSSDTLEAGCEGSTQIQTNSKMGSDVLDRPPRHLKGKEGSRRMLLLGAVSLVGVLLLPSCESASYSPSTTTSCNRMTRKHETQLDSIHSNQHLDSNPPLKTLPLFSMMSRGGDTNVTGETNAEKEDKESEQGNVEIATTTNEMEEQREALETTVAANDQDEEVADKDNDVDQQVDEEEEEEEEYDSEEEQEEESFSASSLSPEWLQRQHVSTEYRLAGKQAHDEGDFHVASDFFQKAAEALKIEEAETDITDSREESKDNDDRQPATKIPPIFAEEYATCRLHQALCFLKSEQWEECKDVCTDLLEEENTAPDFAFSSAIRARAHHRRAKAFVGLQDTVSALQDARAAAFLGDRKAVALYGKLMRESSSSAASFTSGDAPVNPSAALFESLLSKSGPTSSSPSSSGALDGFNPVSLLLGNNGPESILSSLGGGGKTNALAKSVLKSLSKRAEDPQTHQVISNFLQSSTKEQWRQYATMAGLEIPEPYLDRITRVFQKVTPKTIRRTVRSTKVVVYFIKLISKIAALLRKYQPLIAAWMLLQWAKSGILRTPVDPEAEMKQPFPIKILRKFSTLLRKYQYLKAALFLLRWTKSTLFRPVPVDRAGQMDNPDPI